jgi:hypothetical protein
MARRAAIVPPSLPLVLGHVGCTALFLPHA